tara:strand:- start:639 stop:3977 length:3339 start_codon:yes stop_codon:yes gene_type:complete
MFDSSDYLHGNTRGTSGTNSFWYTYQKFTDPSAWYHIVAVYDLGVSTPGLEIYVNGIKVSIYGNIGNYDQHSGGTHTIGGPSYMLDAYLAEYHHLDGIAISGTTDTDGSVTGTVGAVYMPEFGEFDSNGVWNPKEYTGSHGTHGYYLDFKDNSSNAALGSDAAGSNNWTVSNITASAGQTVTVGAATGALPILNTSGDQGGTATSGNRTDSNASNLELALPLYGANNATTFYDNSGNNRTVNNTGTQVKTLYSRFYGSSAYFDGNDFLNIANTNNCFQFSTNSFTVELWARPNSTSGDQYILSWECSGPNAGHAGFNIYNGSWRIGGFNGQLYTGNEGLVAGKWVHIAWSKEGGLNRIFINGKKVSEFAANPNFTANTDLHLGAYASSGNPHKFVGYMNDFRVYKGVAKYTSDFNPPTIGDNAAAAGTDSLLDSPTNYEADTGNNGGNYCVLNPLSNDGVTLTNGNLDFYVGPSDRKQVNGTIAVSSGKWYWEIYITSDGALIGIEESSYDPHSGNRTGLHTGGYAWRLDDGYKYGSNGSISTLYDSSVNAGDLIGVALDLDAGTLTYYKNGSSLGTAFTGISGSFVPSVGDGSNTRIGSGSCNFGQRPFAQTPPTDHKPLCTQNLPDFVVGTSVFDAKTYTGNGGTKVIDTYNFSPDFAWFKQRDTNGYHTLIDTLRTRTKGSYINTTTNQSGPAEFTSDANKDVVSFDSDGFTLGPNNQTGVNDNTAEMVAWAWDAGDAANATSVSAGSLSSNLYAYGTYSSKWNDTSSPGSTGTVNSGANAFNGDMSNYASLNSSNTFSKWKPNTPIQVNSSLRVLASGINSGNNQVAVNGTYFYVTNKPKWYTITASYLTEIRLRDVGSTHGRLWAVEVDGKLLIDNSITPPSLPSIATSYRANDEAGFSIVSYQGDGNTATVATGLSGEPGMILVKDRGNSSDWPVYHRGFDDPGNNVNILNNLSTVQSISGYWTGTRSNIIGLKSGSWAHNTSGRNYIAYCWAQREGFSQFSEYRGDGQPDGPFIYTGFRPRWILIKHTGGQDWVLFDTARDIDNDNDIEKITANEINGEVTHSNWIDIYSNGFKLTTNSAALNENGTKYIYSAFAEHPLKLARAR